jgi:bifunctional non-homologous end joining protein LigD
MVSTPVTWEELERPAALGFTAPEVLDRVAEHGDLLRPMLNNHQKLP